MTTEVITLTPETDIVQAAKVLLDNGINGAPVVDGQGPPARHFMPERPGGAAKAPARAHHLHPAGWFRHASPPPSRWKSRCARSRPSPSAEAMTPNPVTVKSDTGLETIAGLMVDSHFHTLPVVDDGRLVGIIGKEDVLKTLLFAPKGH